MKKEFENQHKSILFDKNTLHSHKHQITDLKRQLEARNEDLKVLSRKKEEISVKNIELID